MANRRMFSNRIANSAKFLQMPSESQLLYFHLILRADDDGIVESYPVVRLLGLAPDSFKILIAKDYIRKLNEDQVIVITDWNEHNTIRADRKVDSIYKHLLNETYPEIPTIEPKPRSDVKNNSVRIKGGQSTDGISKVKLSKVKLSKDREREQNQNDFDLHTPKKRKYSTRKEIDESVMIEIAENYNVPYKFVEDCWDSAINWLDAKGKRQKNYKAFLSNWVKREKASYILKSKKLTNNRGGVYVIEE